MLGRLAKSLRLCGFSAEYRRSIGDWEMLRHCMAAGLVLLTRDRGVMNRWQVSRGKIQALLVESVAAGEQLDQVLSSFGLEPREAILCSVCNALLEPLPYPEARDRVPPYVFKTQKSFHACPLCGRVYWKATHWRGIEKIRGEGCV
jgi:uncharacterized protein with PIN domain